MNLTDEKVLGAASGRDSDAPVARPAMQCHDGQEPAGGPGVGRGRREEAAVPVLKRQDGRDGQHLRRQIRGLQPEKLPSPSCDSYSNNDDNDNDGDGEYRAQAAKSDQTLD